MTAGSLPAGSRRCIAALAGWPGRASETAAGEVDRDPEPGCGGERGDDADRPGVPQLVGDGPGDQSAGDVAHVAPEAIDADGRGAGDGGDRVGDGGDQGRVDERGAGAKRNCADDRQGELGVG